MNEPKVILRRGKESAIERKHPWIFSGAIQQVEREIKDGELVSIFSSNNTFLAKGHWQNSSISVRILTFENVEIKSQFWFDKLSKAKILRENLTLVSNSKTNVFRLVHGEGDGLPGLIIDYYSGNIIIQSHSVGMHLVRNEIAEALKKLFASDLKTIYYKSEETLPKLVELEDKEGFLYGNDSFDIVQEYGCKFNVNWVTGQKTGFFIDQRENRDLLGKYCNGKNVLNTFCYTGGFSVAALKNGAKSVVSVDSSKTAIALTDENLALNDFKTEQFKSIAQDTISYLNQMEEIFDVIVLDPPAYAKHLKARHNAIQGYKRLNTIAMKKIGANGIIFTFSCSQVVDRNLFEDTIFAAAIESGRNIKILHHLSQPADHPVSIYHPEGEYLKGLVIYVE